MRTRRSRYCVYAVSLWRVNLVVLGVPSMSQFAQHFSWRQKVVPARSPCFHPQSEGGNDRLIIARGVAQHSVTHANVFEPLICSSGGRCIPAEVLRPTHALATVSRSRGAHVRRWARLSSRRVSLKSRAHRAGPNCQVTPAGPTHPAAPIRRRHRDTHCARERPSLTAERGLRGAVPHSTVSRTYCRPRDRTPHRTGALAAAARQPHPKSA